MGQQGDRLGRLGRLLGFFLERERAVTRAEIEAAFPQYRGASGRRRFEEDKKALRATGVPLEVDDVFDTYLVRRSRYYLPPLDLTEAERAALSLAAGLVDLADVAWAEVAGTKLGAFPADLDAPLASLQAPPGLPRLFDAFERRLAVRFGYRGQDRVVHPYGVPHKNGHWYVVGPDVGDGVVKAFRVERIEGEVRVDERQHFERPDGFDAAAKVPSDAATMGSGPTQVAKVRLDARIAWLLAGPAVAVWPDADGTAAGTDGDGEPGSVVVEVPVNHPDGLVDRILAFGELAVVESPPELRAAVIARLRELAG